MTNPQAEPSAHALGESLAVQLAALRSQVVLISQRLEQAGLRGDLDLAARFEELAQAVADALDVAAPRRPAAPCWIGLDRQAFSAQLAEVRRRADTVQRQHYCGYELRDCWPSHITPSGNCPRWPPHGTTPTAANAPTWPVPWSSTTAGSRHHAPHRRHHPHLRTGMRHPPPPLMTGRNRQSARSILDDPLPAAGAGGGGFTFAGGLRAAAALGGLTGGGVEFGLYGVPSAVRRSKCPAIHHLTTAFLSSMCRRLALLVASTASLSRS